MNPEERFALIMRLIDQQERALFVVGQVVYEGFLISCLNGRVEALAHPYGTDLERETYRWSLDEVDFDVLRDESEATEDELQATSRELAERAKQWDELSLAEQLVAIRTRGEGTR